MKQSRTQCLAILVLLALLSACAPAQVQTLPTLTNTISAQTTDTVESSIAPTQNATSVPTATSELSCPPNNPGISPSMPEDSDEFETLILNYLNEGGDPVNLEAATSKSETLSLYVLSSDLDGDLLPEIVIGDSNFYGDPATIRIYHCEHNNYQLVKTFTLDNKDSSKPEFATKIFSSEPSFIIVRIGHTVGWGQDFLAIGWRNSEWQLINLATGSTPSEISLFDQNADGTKEVFLKTKTAATPGGGIGRVVVDSYAWNGEEFIFTSSTMPPGPDRVHYLGDAETVLKDGNPLLAISYYEIAARDANISSYSTTYEFEHEQTALAKPYQQAFAFFRIIEIWHYLDRPDVAFQYLEEMSEAFPQGKPGNEFVLMAQVLSAAYENGSGFTQSCMEAVYLLQTQYGEVFQNHIGDWGVANPMYSARSDICKLE